MSLHARTALTRARRPSPIQVRTLWWWSRHSSEPQLPFDENFEERMARHHKMLRSRYSRAFARRALRDKKVIAHWFQHGNDRLSDSSYCTYQPRTSDSAPSNKSDKQSHNVGKGKSDIPEDLSFESFRARIDRAIAEDPHGCLFGRPSNARQSPRYSSFDPFSWNPRNDSDKMGMDTPPEFTRTRMAKGKSALDSASCPPTVEAATAFPARKDDSHSPSQTDATAAETEKEMSYVYDPISMRKVLSRTNSLDRVKKSSEDKLSSDHGVEIPVKTYQSHKVYGYDPSDPALDGVKSVETTVSRAEITESSKEQNLCELMYRAKGNKLDTSAQFTEMTRTQSSKETEEPSEPHGRKRESPAPDDSTPLFTGTTYETRDELDTNPIPMKEDWLAKEGFRTYDPHRHETNASADSLDTTIKEYVGFKKQNEEDHVAAEEGLSQAPVEIHRPILEPALNRIQATPALEPENDAQLLETSLDRHLKQDGAVKSSTTDKTFRESIPSTQEDMDLLRASDVRAATRATRYTKQEAENRKNAARQSMEGAWRALQDGSKNEENHKSSPPPKNAGAPASKSLDDFQGQLREHLNGIMSKTKQSLAASSNSTYASYVRDIGGKKWADLTTKLVFEDQSLSKAPSIFTGKPPKPSKSSTPNPEVEQALEESKERTSSLREATARTRSEREKTEAQLSQLSNDVRAVYENEYGPINIAHRQPCPSGVTGQAFAPETSDSACARTVPPLLNATVKPGVVTDPVIDAHVSTFEPKFAELVDGAKTIRRELHEAKMAIRAIESGRPSNVWAVPSLADSNFGQKRITFNTQLAGGSEPESFVAVEEAMAKPVGGVGGVDPGREQSKDETVPDPVFSESGSPEWNDEQIPPIESLRTKGSDAPYLNLVYDDSTGKVTLSPMNEPTHLSTKRADLIEVLGRLKHAPEFLKHFTPLRKAGYSLVDGGEDMLVFTKRLSEHLTPRPSSDTDAGPNKAEPTKANQQAATVLDEMPTEIDAPGPAAPTAPPFNPAAVNSQVKVKRQEDVFSGTLRPSEAAYEEDSFGRRFTRRLRIILLTIATLGAGAYMIGFVAEALGAQAQRQNGAEDSRVSGPRKRIVMTGQRPGIFSTESSR
ncbi:hypothetical protein PV08_00046 [Exophiala spinifera]|uniref:Uncharacterized protein n=1 Tax=Exophiala spinifera TaxID=91928 RepID=A0A0D2C7F0_9EURO|nr:uncharacterized protein PV08_00046 [Exophiala spinifera]KIW19474.1 hypothetical protein PV08_00046 [Exophiala spinifera]